MNSIKELIKLIEVRPSLYLGKNSITCLKSFLDGWYLRDKDTVSDVDLVGGFQQWIESKYEITSSHSWNNIILFYSQDENDALTQFFELWKEWLSTQ